MKTIILCGALSATLLSSTVAAQTAPARPAATPPGARPAAAAAPSNPGPVIAGVCVLDGAAAIANSAAGRAANTRLQTLTQQVQAELQAQQTPLTTEATAINALPEAQRGPRRQALGPRVQAFQTLAQTREQELRLTQSQALQRIETELQAVVSQIYVQRGCGLMLDRAAVVYTNPALDVTPAAIAALNTRLPTITFNRATLPATPAGR
ncbi:MAG: OmpH family outer membrane protein [Proteobacteria bacterium]|nr:OmpH family outer membrane protein [Pseudomonadota bacterium]